MKLPQLHDVYGQAILDHYKGKKAALLTFSSIAGKDELPLSHLFRSFNDMPTLEQLALNLAKGKILDIGCGTGSHSLYLQERGHAIKSIDISKGAIKVCQSRGLTNALCENFWELTDEKFDTILSMMNGAGISGTLSQLPIFLNQLKSLLHRKGQVLMDSSDLIYMYQDEKGGTEIPFNDRYYGEIDFEFEYNGKRSGKFNWLYIDYFNLEKYATDAGFNCELILKGDHYDYLARLTLAQE